MILCRPQELLDGVVLERETTRQHHINPIFLDIRLHRSGDGIFLMVHVDRIDIQPRRLHAGGYIRDPKREMIPCADRIDKARHHQQIIQ